MEDAILARSARRQKCKKRYFRSGHKLTPLGYPLSYPHASSPPLSLFSLLHKQDCMSMASTINGLTQTLTHGMAEHGHGSVKQAQGPAANGSGLDAESTPVMQVSAIAMTWGVKRIVNEGGIRRVLFSKAFIPLL